MAEGFPREVADKAFDRAQGYCECTRKECNHPRPWLSARCTNLVVRASRGSEVSGGWEAHHKNRNGEEILSNCEVLCQTCHKQTSSYGQGR